METISLTGARIFDGTRFADAEAVILRGGRIVGIGRAQGRPIRLGGGTLAPGFLDLQVNGAGGIQVGAGLAASGIAAICDTQARLGATGCLPTLITDTPRTTAAIIDAAIQASRAGTPGFLGLHLEGPHLDVRRKGAHDAALIRPMTEADLAMLLQAARELPLLKVTLAPEAASTAQIAALARAGILVSLGHTDTSAAAAKAATAAGARCVTHLFNAMSQMTAREPGLVGTALDSGIYCGLIADGIHVDPATMRVALAAKRDNVFLVSDCMAFAGTSQTSMHLAGRTILRHAGRLTLEDGTLAGADLSLARAIAVLIREAGIEPERALAMATSIPARLIGKGGSTGEIAPRLPADLVHLDEDWTLAKVWRKGEMLEPLTA